MHKATILLILLLSYLSSVDGQSQVDHSIQVKILTFNIYHGATTNGSFDLDTIASVILRTDPDLVALQEVDFKTNRAKNYDLATELGWRTKMVSIFGRAMPYDGGEYGEAILSKWSFINTRNVLLPYSDGNEPRAALEITTVIPSGDTITFIGTHLDHLKDDTDRVAQASKINDTFSTNKYPAILAGDLNDLPGSKTIEILEEIWNPSYHRIHPKATFPSNHPIKKIDYVMFYPLNKWSVISTEVIQDKVASDHCAYLVTLQLKR